MRLGPRSRNTEHEQAPPPLPATVGASIPTLGSERLQRVARYFDDQASLLEQMREQVERELVPLTELLARQRQTMQRMLQNLEERLRPLNDYADGEAANLQALEQRLDGDGKEYVWRSFQDYMAQQRERVEETRRRIDEQRRPMIEHDADQRATVEVALSRFDQDLDALEENLVDQRRVMMRMLDAMRSESFVAVKDFLASREAAFEEAVQAHVTDPAQLGARLKELTLSRRQASVDDPHLGAVLSSSEASDERLGAAGQIRPRALASPHDPPQPGRASGAEANAERSA